MKKVLVLAVVLMMAFAGVATAATLDVVGKSDEAISTGRTIDDYVEALKYMVKADEAGDVISPERNDVKYLFVPLYKDGELIGYGSWVNTIIYSHPEDIVAVVSPEGSILKWWPLDANDHHPEMKDEDYISRYYGMTLDTPFNPEVDVISGSTLSSYTFFFEMKNMLLVYEGFGPGAEAE